MVNFKDYIVDVADFPIKGIIYKDITPMLISCFKESIDSLEGLYDRDFWSEVDCIAGIESRGFIFASALAYRLNKGFLPIRKQGKLPRPAGVVTFDLEYGTAVAEMHSGSGKVLIVDDIIATGGTIIASANLAAQVGFEVVGLCAFLDLNMHTPLIWEGKQAKAVVSY